jgi:hypothetical protein
MGMAGARQALTDYSRTLAERKAKQLATAVSRQHERLLPG